MPNFDVDEASQQHNNAKIPSTLIGQAFLTHFLILCLVHNFTLVSFRQRLDEKKKTCTWMIFPFDYYDSIKFYVTTETTHQLCLLIELSNCVEN